MATPEPRQQTVALRPADVANQRFMMVKRGYDTEEVDAYLRQVSEDVERLQGEVKWLRSSAEHLERRGSTAQDAAYTRLANEFITVMKAADEAGRQVLDAAEEEARTMLDSARERSERSISSAEQRSKELLASAESRSAEMLAVAEERSTQMLAEAGSRSAEMLATAESRSREMVTSAEARAAAVLADAQRRADTMLADARQEAEEVGVAARRAAEEVIATWSRGTRRRAAEERSDRPSQALPAAATDSPEAVGAEAPPAPAGSRSADAAFGPIEDGWASRIWGGEGADGATQPGEATDAPASGPFEARAANSVFDDGDLDLGFDRPLFDLFGPDAS